MWALRKHQFTFITLDPEINWVQKADPLTVEKSYIRGEQDQDVTDQFLPCQYTNPASQRQRKSYLTNSDSVFLAKDVKEHATK